jgi:ribosomal protein S24E
MKLEVKEERKNPLAKRSEVRILIDHAGSATPSRQDILGEAAKKLKKDRKLIIVDSIFSARARASSDVKILVYSNEKDIPKHKLEKMKRRMAKKEKPAEPAQEPTPEGKPAESPAVGPGKAEETQKEEKAEEKEGG